MDLGGLVFFILFFIQTVFAVSACAALLFSFVAAACGARHGARHGATITRKVLAILCGFLTGVAVAAIVGFVIISWDSPPGLILGLVLGPLFGGAASYGIARSEASWTKHSGA